MRAATRVLVFPAFTINPYLELMHAVPRSRGFDILAVRTLDDLYSAGEKLERGDVFHMHWTTPVTKTADDELAARALVATFSRFVDQLKARGVKVIWTIHNRLPHEPRFLGPELALNRFLSSSADVVHVMSGQTAEVVADLYPLPADRVKVIPHPSYHGVHSAPASNRQARERLGLAADERTVLAFGRLRAYKGIDTLCDALTVIAERGGRLPTLLVAGQTPRAVRAEIGRRLPRSSRVISHFGFVDDADVGDWFAAADVAVFPFRSILNSGSVHLAATLGVPVILPGESHLREQFGDEPWVRFYDVADAVGSLATLLAEPDPADHAASMESFSLRISPLAVSRMYADLLTDLSASTPRPSLDVAPPS